MITQKELHEAAQDVLSDWLTFITAEDGTQFRCRLVDKDSTTLVYEVQDTGTGHSVLAHLAISLQTQLMMDVDD